ncbi:MAG: hypothetical protein JW862_09695 [Anaerolineales bacterium]|nr:hypothetical protein [Anaerolineales bacterium]
MLAWLWWYLIISLLGWLTFPLAYRLLPGLAERGYALSRTLGWLLWGFFFWISGVLGITANDLGGQFLALLILAGLSYLALRKTGWAELKAWLQAQRRLVWMVELLFLLAFAALAFVRSANPEIMGTEKPMELAFINAILRSPGLPPYDPWLSGYAISYYYFGYLLVSMLARLAGTSGAVAFNLGLALVFALGAVGAYGVLYSLLAQRSAKQSPSDPERPALFSALLGPFFAFLVSNFGGLLHLLQVNGIFWRQDASGNWRSAFWSWLNIGRYAQPPSGEIFSHWWWWQASRIVQDYDYSGASKEIIDEFPFFSFLLGDLHPHVLAIPFAFLAIALALNVLLGGAAGQMRWLGIRLRIDRTHFLMAALGLGALGFLNTWDFPFYVALLAGAYLLWLLRNPEPGQGQLTLGQAAGQFIGAGFLLGLTGGLLYLPFYLGFSSQAGGLIPNLLYVTWGAYTWLMFGVLWIPIFVFLVYQWRQHADRASWPAALKIVLAFVALLFAISLLLAAVIPSLHAFQAINPDAAIAAEAFLGSLAAPGWSELLIESLYRRLTVPGTLLTLVAMLTLALGLLLPKPAAREDPPPAVPLPVGTVFVLLLTLVAGLLVLGPEFVYLRDLFGYRINTIFKFYYQAWLMWSLAAAYATVRLWQNLPAARRVTFQVTMLVFLAASLTYPVLGLWSKTGEFNPAFGYTLDGSAFFKRNAADDAAVADWLLQAPLGVVTEAIGGSYSSYARMAIFSGQPAVLGWDFHELQWRGGNQEMGSRQSDIARLYCTASWEEARQILAQYQVRYVVLGNLERIAYGADTPACPGGLSEGKFIRNMQLVFQQGNTSLYQVPEYQEPAFLAE